MQRKVTKMVEQRVNETVTLDRILDEIRGRVPANGGMTHTMDIGAKYLVQEAQNRGGTREAMFAVLGELRDVFNRALLDCEDDIPASFSVSVGPLRGFQSLMRAQDATSSVKGVVSATVAAYTGGFARLFVTTDGVTDGVFDAIRERLTRGDVAADVTVSVV